LLIACGALSLAAAIALAPAAAPSLEGAALAQGGEAFEARLQVSGARELAAFDATLVFDAEVISPTGVIGGDFLPEGSALLPLRADEPGRLVVGIYNPAGKTVTGDGHLATVTFQRLAARSPRLRLVGEESGAYDASGKSIAPPARIVIGGLPPQRLLLPWLRR
jgi:hypothetical protein